jgi:hypothetical protein
MNYQEKTRHELLQSLNFWREIAWDNTVYLRKLYQHDEVSHMKLVAEVSEVNYKIRNALIEIAAIIEELETRNVK